MELPIGCIFCYPSPVCPEGFLPCDGRELSKTTYSQLYKLIGGTWGETATTFCLPDLRGQFVRGWDDGDGVDPDSGADNVRKFGSEQTDTFQGHGHELYIDGEMSECSLPFNKNTIEYKKGDSSASFSTILSPSEIDSINRKMEYVASQFGFLKKLVKDFGLKHSHRLPEMKVKDAQSSTFQKVRTSVETRPKNVALMYCIKVV